MDPSSRSRSRRNYSGELVRAPGERRPASGQFLINRADVGERGTPSPAAASRSNGEARLSAVQRFAEGRNYSIDLEGTRARCRVWSRPDLDSAQGAALAVEKVTLFQRLAQGEAQHMSFDLSQAPAVTGPKTQAALGQMLAAWEQAGKPIAVISGPLSIQQLQLRRLIATFAPQQGALFTSLDDAKAWLEARPQR